jgi:methyltransferase (TIGR00027 family)
MEYGRSRPFRQRCRPRALAPGSGGVDLPCAMADTPLISHISDTARWVAVYRAMETERPDAIFRDPFARRLAGPRGEAIVQGMPKGRAFAWPMIVRTAVMDEIILRTIAEEGVDCVLNLAAGLDARPWRLTLPASLQWVDVDHPEMIDLKGSTLARERTTCRYQGVRLDLADVPGRQALFERIGGAARRVLVITEGLLVYLPEAAVAGLATDLHAQPSFGLWLTDLASPGLLKMMGKNWGPVVAKGNAPFVFGPADAPAFFRGLGWEEREFRSIFHEGIRLKRTIPFAGLWVLLGRLMGARRRAEMQRFSGVSLMEPAEAL